MLISREFQVLLYSTHIPINLPLNSPKTLKLKPLFFDVFETLYYLFHLLNVFYRHYQKFLGVHNSLNFLLMLCRYIFTYSRISILQQYDALHNYHLDVAHTYTHTSVYALND